MLLTNNDKSVPHTRPIVIQKDFKCELDHINLSDINKKPLKS